MNCFECAKTDDVVPAVGLCRHCGSGSASTISSRHVLPRRRNDVWLRAQCPARQAAARRSGRDRRGGSASQRRRLVTVAAANPVAAGQRDHELALLAKALGHPARVRILRLLLARDSCYCGELVDELPLAQATVSQHLKVLKEAGLIVGEIDGLRTGYCASRDRLSVLHELVNELIAETVEADTDGCN